MRRTWLILLAPCLPTLLPAQWQVTADAGAAHIRQAGIPESNAWTIGGGADVLGERAALRSRLLGSQAGERWTGQALVIASIIGPNTIGPGWELSGGFSAFGETNTPSTTSGEAMARLRFGDVTTGGSFGVGAGVLSDPRSTRALYRAQATAWRTLTRDQFVGDVSLVTTAGGNLAGISARRYTDLSASWRRDHRGIELGATAGFRAGWSAAATGGWGSVDAAAWVAPNLALVASAGRWLEDVPRGVPSTQFVSVALRIAARSHPSVGDTRATTAPRTVITRSSVSVRIDSASRVEMMADFTAWAVVALERSGNEWRILREVPPGLHRIAIRVDGGEWIAPPGLPRAPDELGGVVGLITVP
jgi:hypothetical protein